MTREEFTDRYERDWAWREAWYRLSVRVEPGRLQLRQERIEARAETANRRIGALLLAFHGALVA